MTTTGITTAGEEEGATSPVGGEGLKTIPTVNCEQDSIKNWGIGVSGVVC